MNINEFNSRVKNQVNDKEYKKIEVVYNHSLLIPDINGKEEIARLYNMGGMEYINRLFYGIPTKIVRQYYK